MYKSIAVTAFATLLAIALPHAYNDYRIYLSYGPGGLPYNPLGWMINHVMMRPFASEQFSTTVYEEKVAAGETLTYLDDEMVTAKKRDRPAVGPHVAPHRQLTDFAGDEIKLKLVERLTELAAQYPRLVRLAQSKLERHAEALFLVDNLENAPSIAQTMRGEVAHIHRLKDGSLHAVLPPADCKKLFDAGWAQRHGLSGVFVPKFLTGGKEIGLPSEYLLIYAPRTDEELDFVMEIVVASVKYMAGVGRVTA